MVPGFFKRFFLFRNYLIIAAIAVLILTIFAKQFAFFPIDLYITREIQLIQIPFLVQLLLFISWLGNFYQTIISVLIGCLLFLYIRRKDLALGLLVSTGGAVTISEVMKRLVGRPRPDPTLIHQLEKFLKDDSFPSGHVMFFCGFYGFLLFAVFVLVKDRIWRNLLSGILLALIILIGISRIYKGSHWFSDTLASYLVGSIWLYLVAWMYHRLVKKDEINPKELKIPEDKIPKPLK